MELINLISKITPIINAASYLAISSSFSSAFKSTVSLSGPIRLQIQLQSKIDLEEV